MMKVYKRTPLKDLSGDAIDVQSQDVDWTGDDATFGTYPDDWDYFEAQECDVCGRVRCTHGEEQCNDDGHGKCDGYMGSSDGPMMNFAYELPVCSYMNFDPEEAAIKIADLPLCIVQRDDKFYLALTGGGMDLSWEICTAYLRLGFLPPVRFADLPRMSGRGTSKVDRYIISACMQSFKVAGSCAASGASRLKANFDPKKMAEDKARDAEQSKRYHFNINAHLLAIDLLKQNTRPEDITLAQCQAIYDRVNGDYPEYETAAAFALRVRTEAKRIKARNAEIEREASAS